MGRYQAVPPESAQFSVTYIEPLSAYKSCPLQHTAVMGSARNHPPLAENHHPWWNLASRTQGGLAIRHISQSELLRTVD
jgi:hypothetical protein